MSLESWFWLAKSIFVYAQLNIYKPPSMFLEFIYACWKSSRSIIFLTHSSFRNPGIWLAESILAHKLKPEFSQTLDWCSHRVNMYFHFKTTTRKSDQNFFGKNLSNLYFWLFGGIFYPFWGTNGFSWKIGSVSF